MTGLDHASFYFAHEDAFLIPVEHLGAQGMSDAYARELEARGLVPDGFRATFDAAWGLGFSLSRALASKCPDIYVPPRLTNVVVLADDAPWPPYFRPFEQMSSVVYAADFDPTRSCAEHGAFQLLLSERSSQTRRAGSAFLECVPFLVSLDDDATVRVARALRASERPDARALGALAELLPGLRANVRADGLHEMDPLPEGYARVRGTPLAVDRAFVPDLQALVKVADAIAAEVTDAHAKRQRATAAAGPEHVLAFLRSDCPRVLIVERDGSILWDPDRADETDRVRAALEGAGDRALTSLIEDLRVVADVTKTFFDRVAEAASFSVPSASLEQEGGVFVHHERKMIAYALEQPSFSPLREEAPPFHRLLLAARAMHEWGHLAVDGGVVPVPVSKEQEAAGAHAALEHLFSRIVNGMPADAAELADRELRAMRDEGTRLADLPFSRMEDYRANLLSKRLLSDAALQAYVRANVRTLAAENVGMLRKLARYAYEAQYLWLADVLDPWRYLMESTYFREEFVDSKLVTEGAARELVEAVGRMCRCYEVDSSRLVPSESGP